MVDRRSTAPENEHVAALLRQAAEILQAQRANPFRVSAYRKAAEAVEGCTASLREILVHKGRAGLEEIPGVGTGISAAIAEMLRTGRWTQLERLRGSLDPVALFRTVPGIGPELAQRIHDALDVDTLEALEVACHDGRLDGVAGVGKRRAAAIRSALAEMLGRSRLRRAQAAVPLATEPQLGLLLDVDREYREKAETGKLPTIAPRRFNPEGESWLPVLHMSRAGWHFTALFSNTAKAHELRRTRDWVVVYFYDDQHAEGQRTIVTEQRGPLAGRRCVRGREAECRDYYRRETARAVPPADRLPAAG